MEADGKEDLCRQLVDGKEVADGKLPDSSSDGAYCGVIHEQGTKPYKYNHMQEERLHKGSP